MSRVRLEQINRELARKDLTEFACYVDPKMAHIYQAKHLRYLAEKLMGIITGEVKRLIVCVPNRHWKSSLCTMKFPAFFIGQRYTAKLPHQVMVISHTTEKAEEFSEYSRNLVRDVNHKGRSRWLNVFPNVRISPTRQAAKEWGLLDPEGSEEAFPTMTAGSMLAPPVGSGADLLVIDDPLKNSQEARSAATQNAHWHNWVDNLRTRLNSPEAAVLVVMTRRNPLDLVGRMLLKAQEDPLADQWEVVTLPGLAYTSKERAAAQRLGMPVSDEDPLGRKPGEALWPERFPRSYHLTTRANDAKAFSTIGQQLPVPEEGNLLGRDNFKQLPAPPAEGKITWCIAMDVAFSEKQLAKDDPDFNVFGLMGKWQVAANDVRLILGTLVRTQKGLNAAETVARQFALAMEKLLGQRVPLIGDKATLDQVLLDNLRGQPDLLNWVIRSLGDDRLKKEIGTYTGDKVAKAQPWFNRAEGGRFYLIDEGWALNALLDAFPSSERGRLFGDEPLAWQEKFFTEVEAFPDYSHDDMVDMVSVGSHYFGGSQRDGVEVLPVSFWDLTAEDLKRWEKQRDAAII